MGFVMATLLKALQGVFFVSPNPVFASSALSVTLVASFYWIVFVLSRPLLLALIPRLRRRSRKDQLSAFIRVPSLVNCLVCDWGVFLFSLLFFCPSRGRLDCGIHWCLPAVDGCGTKER